MKQKYQVYKLTLFLYFHLQFLNMLHLIQGQYLYLNHYYNKIVFPLFGKDVVFHRILEDFMNTDWK